MVSLIITTSHNNGIEFEGNIPWDTHKEDVLHFKKHTIGNIVIMGRKTFELMDNRPFPNRHNIVLSKTLKDSDNIVVVQSMCELWKEVSQYKQTVNKFAKVFCIGGTSIYHLLMASGYIQDIYITRLSEKYFNGDVDRYFYIPQWSELISSEASNDGLLTMEHYRIANVYEDNQIAFNNGMILSKAKMSIGNQFRYPISGNIFPLFSICKDNMQEIYESLTQVFYKYDTTTQQDIISMKKTTIDFDFARLQIVLDNGYLSCIVTCEKCNYLEFAKTIAKAALFTDILCIYTQYQPYEIVCNVGIYHADTNIDETRANIFPHIFIYGHHEYNISIIPYDCISVVLPGIY